MVHRMPESSPELIASAVNARPITTKQGLLEHLFKLSFGGFVYNQIWEDPEVDAEALQLDADSRIMTISSGGCNVLNYLARGVASIDAVDLNENHLHLLKLKLAALRHFPTHDDFFAFFGKAKDPENVRRYETYLRPNLDEDAISHWEGGKVRRSLRRERFRYFERGLYKYASMGAFLRFMNGVARRKGMEPSRLLDCKTLEEQEDVFKTEIAPFFEMRVVKGLVKLPFLLHGLGVPPRQFQAFKNDAVDGSLLEEYRLRVKRLATQFPIQDNYFAWQAFGGQYDHNKRQAIPEYLKAENFELLKRNVDRVRTHLISMNGFLQSQAPGSLNRFVMLDAQDWMEPHQIADLWQHIASVAQPNSRIIFRSGAASSPVETALPPELKGRVKYEQEISNRLFQRDRSAIYGGFHLYTMN
jgi:S-adenosylmethionine-diacylglycerol 3-amino-3-carboxypropyl transferase